MPVVFLAVVGMRDVALGLAQEFLATVAQHVAEALVHAGIRAVEIDLRDADRRLVEDVAVPALEPLAVRDVDDGADEPRDIARGIGVGGLVEDGLARLPAGLGDRGFVGLRPGPSPELHVHGVKTFRRFPVLRVELVHGLSDERLAGNAEERLPCLVDAEIAAVGALEEDGIGQGLDQLLGPSLRLGEPRLAVAQVARDDFGDPNGPPAGVRERVDEPRQQEAQEQPHRERDRRQDVSRHRESRLGCGEGEVPLPAPEVERPGALKQRARAGGGRAFEEQVFGGLAARALALPAQVDQPEAHVSRQGVREDVLDHVPGAHRDAHDAQKGAPAIVERVQDRPRTKYGEAQDHPGALPGIRLQHDALARDHATRVARTLRGEAAPGFRDEVEAERAPVLLQGLDVGERHVERAVARRANREIGVSGGIDARVGPDASLEGLLRGVRHHGRKGDVSHLRVAVGQAEALRVAVEGDARDVGRGVEQPLEAVQHVDVARQPGLDGVADVEGRVLECHAGPALHLALRPFPGADRDRGPDEQDDPRGRKASHARAQVSRRLQALFLRKPGFPNMAIMRHAGACRRAVRALQV